MTASLLCLLASSASAAGPLPNPCALISKAQVSGILGSKIVSTAPAGNSLYRSCAWTAKSIAPTGVEPVQRALRIQIARSTKAAFLQQADHQPNAQRVAGVGQAAWTARPTNALNVYSNGFTLELSSVFTASPLAAEKTAAKIVLRQL
ncbi:MAG TPA: hypothetical protein VGL76_03405 [Gaiellaceae bacterium]